MINTTQTKDKKRRGIASLLDSFGEQTHTPEQTLELAPVVHQKPETLQQSLNRFIERCISFDTAADGFEVCRSELLTTDEKQFIEANRPQILCHLQQSLLVKHSFSVSADMLDEFSFEIAERQAIIAESEPDTEKVYFAAVSDVSKRWFEELLQNG